MQQASNELEAAKGGPNGPNPNARLRITINRRSFDEETGVKPEMKGHELAALVGVDRDNAKVRRDNGSDRGDPVGVDETVQIHPGDKFLVTRKTVEGGHG